MTKISPLHYLDGCALIKDAIYVATFFDELDQDEYAFTRLCVYKGSAEPNAWSYRDVKFNAVCVCHRLPTSTNNRGLCALSSEGEVSIVENKDNTLTLEKIPDAGFRTGTFGPVTNIREIGTSLFVCGQRGQVYRRFANNDWRHVDQGLVLPPPVIDLDNMDESIEDLVAGPALNCIDGFHEQDLYVVGDEGGAWHYDGLAWARISLPTDEHLQWVRCYERSEVWICGYNGTLLRGNAHDGFRNVSAVEDNDTYWSLAKFQDKVYLSTETGLDVFDGKRIQTVKTSLKPELQDGWRVDAADGVLWTIGPKDIAYYDGQTWVRVHDIDNPPIV